MANFKKDDGTHKTFLIHRLVAETFIENPKPEKYDCVNHIDGNKLNNLPENLEWCNRDINNHHAIEIGLYKCKKPVRQINIITGEIKDFESAREANRITGISYKDISATCHYKQHTAGGYKWEFLD